MATARPVAPTAVRSEVWYAGYGSNLDPGRFGYYLSGGRPPGARRPVPGARDGAPPRDVRATTLAGQMFFGWESPTWGGGISFLDPAADGEAYATAYLLSAGQLADVAAQEMHRDPADDLDLATVLAERRHELGPGRYETLVLVGEIDGLPVLTMTAADVEHLPRNAPSGAYLATVVRGLRDVHGLSDDAVTEHLLGREGAETWAPDEVRRLVAATASGS
ncbi:MAG: hypothetical protein JWO46_3373 [Nocardioidaceae bacterium]|nr:hypothetical protein [Nocardioidaceae bacterium]